MGPVFWRLESYGIVWFRSSLMSSPEEVRAEKVKRVLQRRAFLEAQLPDERETLVDFKRMFEIARDRAKETRT